jgi:hypothetical protein
LLIGSLRLHVFALEMAALISFSLTMSAHICALAGFSAA